MESDVKQRHVISTFEVRAFLSMKESERSAKRRLESLQERSKAAEQALVGKVQQGIPMENGEFSLRLREIERKFPAWKEHFIALAGKTAADEVLKTTEPKAYVSLIVEVA